MTASTKAFQSVGSSVFVASAAPTTLDATGWAAVTPWIEIGELDKIGEVGAKWSLITRTPLKNNIVQKLKGGRNYGSMQLDMGYAPGDVGQVELHAAEGRTTVESVKLVYADGSIDYFQAMVMQYTRTIGGSGDYTQAVSVLEITSAITNVAAP